jgi:hypothetical protein
MRASKWVFLTAGLGDSSFQGASRRLAKAAKDTGIFSDVISLDVDNLKEHCPEVSKKFQNELKENVRGFGYMAWKAEICARAMEGKFGDFDGLVWLDGGCEIYDSAWTRYRFKKQLRRSVETGISAYTLKTPEALFTKESLFTLFPMISKNDLTPQFQTTFFILHGEFGRRIATQWRNLVLSDLGTVDESNQNEFENRMVSHRHDQSVFSLVCKDNAVIPAGHIPPAGNRSLISKVSAARSLVWLARNRSESTLVPGFLSYLGRISLMNVKTLILKNDGTQ